jgi:hypothetical protein
MSDAFRSMRLLILLLLTLVGGWFALPPLASGLLEWWLERQGYEQVQVRLGHPGLRSMTVPRIALARRLTGEMVTLSLRDAQAEYTLLGLASGRVDLLTLKQLSVDIVTSPTPGDQGEHATEPIQDAPDSLLNALTASDAVRRLPFFPWDEVRLEEVKIFREQATGPLRTVVIAGTIKHERETLVAEMLLQGVDTIPYELRISGQSTADMSLQLRAAQPNASPFVLWRSQAIPKEAKIHIEGVLEINVRELAPFLALVVPVGQELQKVDGNVTVHWAGTAAAGVPVSALLKDPGTEVHATVQISAVLPELKGYGRDLALKTTGTLSGNARLIHWTLTAGASATATVSGAAMKAIEPLGVVFHYGSQPLRFDNAQESTGELFWNESPPRFTASGPVNITYGSHDGPVFAEFVVTQMVGRGLALDHAEAKMFVKGSLPAPWLHRLNAKHVTSELHGMLTWTGTTLRGMLNPPSSVAFADANEGPLRIAHGAFHLEDPLRIDLDVGTRRWSASAANWVWRSPRLEVGRSHMAMQRAVFRIERIESSQKTSRADFTASIEGVQVEYATARSAPFDVSVRIETDAQTMKAEIHSRSSELPLKFAADVEHEWSTGRGSGRAALEPVTFTRATFRLAQLWSPWTSSADITEGSVAGTFDWRWVSNVQQEFHLQGGSADLVVERLGGHYRDLVLSGISTKLKMTFEGLERIAISRPAEVAIASIEAGVKVSDLTMTVDGQWDLHEQLPLVEVRNIRCGLLGGTATSQGLRADLGYPPYGLTVLVRELDLHKILSLEQQNGLEGTGILDGTIPVTVTSQGVSVKDGSLEARPPGGVIHYAASSETAQAVTQANANMEIVLQALNNFHYNVLQVGAQYAESGVLQLEARLEGKNPDQKKSPPIRFNLTVQENIPALLKSLRLVGDLEDSVRRRYSKP